MIVKYINSKNESFEFIGHDILPTSGYLHQRHWEVNKENDITLLSVADCTYTIILTLRGRLEDRMKQLDRICDIFEYDCMNNTTGTLYFGDYKIRCFIVTSNTAVSSVRTRTDVELGIYCPKIQWIKEKKYELVMYSNQKNNNGIKQYIYTYPFVYSSRRGAIQIINSSPGNSDFIIRIYGPCTNPFIKIKDIIYQVNVSLANDEFLEIDSHENTIFAFSQYGEKRNLFNFRDKSRSDFFCKIPSGMSIASWDGTFKAEIIIFDKRGEPKWSQ